MFSDLVLRNAFQTSFVYHKYALKVFVPKNINSQLSGAKENIFFMVYEKYNNYFFKQINLTKIYQKRVQLKLVISVQ